MRTLDVLLCLLSVSLAAAGQVLLRAAVLGNAQAQRTGFAMLANWPLLTALVVYVGALLLWMYVLSRVPLSQAFAFFGVTFFLVPFLAHFFLGDPVRMQTWIGAVIILGGILVANWQH